MALEGVRFLMSDVVLYIACDAKRSLGFCATSLRRKWKLFLRESGLTINAFFRGTSLIRNSADP